MPIDIAQIKDAVSDDYPLVLKAVEGFSTIHELKMLFEAMKIDKNLLEKLQQHLSQRPNGSPSKILARAVTAVTSSLVSEAARNEKEK